VLNGDTDAFALLMNKYGAMVVNRIKYHFSINTCCGSGRC
jgi:hypothetical protein